MPVKKDEDGQRSIEAGFEVPGSPEEVWNAIATGKGISSWFVPTTVEEREGGAAVASFGPGMDSVSTITKWNPPRSYIAETEGGQEEDGLGKVATEWIVEARSGGTCVVRVVHRWFASTDDWDGQFEAHAYGWATSFLPMLRLYLAHHLGQACAAFQLTAFSPTPAPETWRAFRSALTIDRESRRVTSTPGAPELSGTLENLTIEDPELLRLRTSSPQIAAALEGMDGEDPELLLRLERPAPGIAHIFIMPLGDQAMVSARFHFFGDRNAAAAPDAERAWNAWLAEHFPGDPPDG